MLTVCRPYPLSSWQGATTSGEAVFLNGKDGLRVYFAEKTIFCDCVKNNEALTFARCFLGAVQAIDREPGFERTMILIDVGLIGVNNYILTRLLQFERSIELNNEFPYAEMTGFAFEIYTLLPIGVFETHEIF